MTGRAGTRGRRRGWLACGGAIAVRPQLWATAVRTAARTARPSWWRRPPFVPVPDRDYLRFRMETQYGAPVPPDATDVVSYLEWCRAQDRLARGHPSP
jgi:hypothetical protein